MTEQQKTELYEQYHGKVMRFLLGKVNNHHTAEDLCSDVFLKVYEKLDDFDETKSSLSTWIFTITRNTLTDFYRLRRVHEEVSEELPANTTVEDDVCRNEMLEKLADALEKLDEKQRTVIVLHYYSGLTLSAVAERMELSYGYVKLLHNKALGALKGFF